MRTCLGCRDEAPRSALLRLALDEQGRPSLDPRGRAPGRGAYLHAEQACVDRALARGGGTVFRALRARADLEAAARLRRELEGALST
jgi:uncharacterized protein